MAFSNAFPFDLEGSKELPIAKINFMISMLRAIREPTGKLRATKARNKLSITVIVSVIMIKLIKRNSGEVAR